MLTSTIKYNKSTQQEQTGSYNQEFLSALSSFGNQIMCRIYVNNTSYQSDEIMYVKRYGVVNLLKSVMYAFEIRINSVVDLKGEVISDLQFGVSADGVNYYLVSYGSCTVAESPSDLAGGFTTLTAYDGMLSAMKNYDPITIVSEDTNYTFFGKVAAAIGLNVGSSIPNTGLMALSKTPDEYTKDNTYRDILDDYAEILGGCILVKNGALELVTPGSSVMTLTAGNLINFAPKDEFPLIDNLIVTSDNSVVYKYNSTETGTIINIHDNRLINTADINAYMSSMYTAIRSWGAYTPIDADSHGYLLFEPCDVVTFSVNNESYRVIWQSNDISITQGISETISSDEPIDRADDYFKSDQEHNLVLSVNTKTDNLSAMVHVYEGGVLVSRRGQTVGALVNADGSFDVAEVIWSNDNKPIAGNILASYGSDLMVMRDASSKDFLRMENLSPVGSTFTEKVTASSKKLTVNYNITSVTSITRVSNSDPVSTYTISGNTINSNSLVNNEAYTVVYTSNDYLLKSFTLGTRKNNSVKGGHSFSVGENNIASGVGAVTIGSNLTANSNYQVIVGNNNVAESNRAFIVADASTNLFSVVRTNGGIICRNPANDTYGYIYSSSDSNGQYLMLSLYGIDNGSIARLKRITLREDNITVDGVEQFYRFGEEISIADTTPYTGYITSTSSVMRFTIYVEKSLQFVDDLTVTQMKGAIIGNNGYIQGESGTATSHQTDWSDYALFSATKVNDHTVRITLTPWTDATGATTFFNVTNNRPLVYVPSYGGLKITCAAL